jgi:hypothetical protein
MDNGIVDNFVITEKGDLVVEGLSVITQSGASKKDVVLDVTQNNNYQFALWASDTMWPFVKNYSFAEGLKEIAIEYFEVPRNLVYGTDDDKKTVMEHLRWENMPSIITKGVLEEEWGNMLCDWFPKDHEYGSKEMQEDLDRINLTYHAAGPMTIREFLQYLGSDVMRKMYEPIWLNRCIKDIVSEGSEIAVVPDCRFTNELLGVKKQGGIVIGLTREPFPDPHISENSFDLEDCDYVIDNENMTIEESCQEMFKILVDLEWLKKKEAPKKSKGTMKINPNREEKNV